MRLIFVVIALIVSVQATPALADKYFAVTPSGATEMLFPNQTDRVVGALAAKCIDVQWTVISSGSNQVVCEAPLNTGQSILGQMLLGNSYSTPPHRYFRFNVAEINGMSRVQASGWMEVQMAFGKINRTDFNGASFHNGMMNFMRAAGGSFPVGTTFPNHAAMGVQVENIQEGKFVSFRITEVEPGSVAEKAGVQVGDIVTKIAGKAFKNGDDYLDATAKAANRPSYEVELVRGSDTIKLTVERAFRPRWTQALTPSVATAASPAPLQPTLSVADELQKLLKLKEQGVLTDSEFEAQKKKLLEEN